MISKFHDSDRISFRSSAVFTFSARNREEADARAVLSDISNLQVKPQSKLIFAQS